MVGIYSNSAGCPFLGIVADTKEKAIEYLNNKYGIVMDYPYYSNGVLIHHYKAKCNLDAFVIKEIEKI